MTTPAGVLFQNPVVKPLSSNGTFMSACTATFFLTGTTALTAIYADGALTTPLANPLSSDASGTFVPIYLNPATTYRIQIKTSAGVLISDTDPYVVPLTSATSLAGVSVVSYGADSTGVADSTAAFQAAVNAVTGGGQVLVPSNGKFLITGNLTIPHNVTLKGPQSFVGTMTSNSMSAPYQTMGGSIALKSTATITMNAGSCIDGLLIFQSGLTFPQTNAANYAGTAITYNGDDCLVKNSMILGFNQAITSTGFQRPKCYDCLMDNNNGISFSGSTDITHIERVHMWNFGTFYPAVPSVDLQRSGIAYNINSDTSGAKLIDCFCFGFNTGFSTQGTGDVGQTFLNCWADSTGAYGTGFAITGGATDTKLTACQASGCISGYLFSMITGLKATMTDCNAFGCSVEGVVSGSGNAGDVIIRGGYIKNCPNAISYQNSGGVGILDVDDVAFDNSNSVVFDIAVASPNVRIGGNNNYGNIAAGTQIIDNSTNVEVAAVASAATVNLPLTDNDFIITGSFSGVSAVNYGWKGRQVTLYFSGTPQINSSTSAYNSIRLNGGSNFTPSSGGSLTLRHNGVQWYEIGRAA